MYEEHKKNDVKATNRPISSYHHYHNNNNPGGSEKKNEGSEKKSVDSPQETKHKPQSAQIHSGSSSSQNLPQKTFDELLKELNDFLVKNKISKKNFIEDDNIFYSFDDFRQMLQGIHYNIAGSYMKILFNNGEKEDEEKKDNNDDFLHMKSFTKKLKFYKLKDVANDSKLLSDPGSVSDSIFTNSSNGKSCVNSVYEIQYLNEEFSRFNKEINNILRSDYRSELASNKHRMSNKKRVQTAKPKTTKIVIESADKKPTQSINSLFPTKSLNQTLSSTKIQEDQNKETAKSKKYNANKIINQRTKEKLKEEENIKNAFMKKDKAFIKDCVIKSVECNKMCEELKIPKFYEIGYNKSGMVGCFITDEDKKCEFITLKAFIVQWRRLSKAYFQKDIEERYAIKEKEDDKKKKDDVAIVNQRKNEKNERLKEVKEVLIETVRLKTKLKNQLDNLEKKIKVSEKVVIEHLIKAGIDIPGVYQDPKAQEGNKTKSDTEKNTSSNVNTINN